MIMKMRMPGWNEPYADWINSNYTNLNSITSYPNGIISYNRYIYDLTEQDNKSVNKEKGQMNKKIKKIILNNPATVIFWNDNSKTVVKCMDGEKYNPLNGIAIAFMKGMLDKKTYNKLKKAAETENTIVLN